MANKTIIAYLTVENSTPYHDFIQLKPEEYEIIPAAPGTNDTAGADSYIILTEAGLAAHRGIIQEWDVDYYNYEIFALDEDEISYYLNKLYCKQERINKQINFLLNCAKQ